MLAFKNRFHGHSSLRFVYKNGRAIRGRLITIKVSENPRRVLPRVAVVVSKKVHKGAVGRNRIRRRLYEIIRQKIDQFSPSGVDVVLIVTSSEIRSMESSELTKLIDDLFVEAHLYKTDS